MQRQYLQFEQRIHELKGYLAEVYMAQILFNAQRQTLPGHFFHTDKAVEVPRFHYVRLRERLGPGAGTEIDVHGGAAIEQWVAESKWLTERKVGILDIQKLLKKAEVVKKDRQAEIMRIWFFSYNGFTKEALEFMPKNGVFWSTQVELDELLEYVNLRKLPKL